MNFLDGSNLLPKDGEALFYSDFLGLEESDRYFDLLSREIAWVHEPILMFGREVLQPRLTAWYGDVGTDYSYSGISMSPLPWTPALQELKTRAELVAKVRFTSVLLNQYRNGSDSVSWHRDDEPELGRHPTIASISLGATRSFQMRHVQNAELKRSVDLTHGSLLLMRGEMQHYWQHCIPKRANLTATRINLTFRVLRAA
ncbi:MAG: alpha-ketoglutarate-dependent dioxygenase AlkB [Bdellovibrionales bacterium]|nr:alpha-ketoglutarate-dependent dioxygenase AlkB [Bdellovibrionales bacterium]